MSRKTFCISFFLRKARTNKAGLTPILARITTNGISKEIYIQCSVPADKWNQSKERATGKDKLCQQVNSYLDEYRARILAVRQELIAKGYEGNCIQIKERLQNPSTLSIMFVAELEKYCNKRQTEVGVRITQLTANKYHRVLRYLKEYVAAHYKKNVVTYRPICGYIFQSVWQCQLVDNRVIIKRFLSASADSKVCIELLDTFRVIPENLALREKNRTSEVGAFDRRRTANESKSDNSGVSTAIHANSDYKRKTECP